MKTLRLYTSSKLYPVLATFFWDSWSTTSCSSCLSMAFLASSYPAKFMAPKGAIQKNLGTAPLNKPKGPSWRSIERNTIDIDTDRPWAVIILVFITSKGVVVTAASPPDKAPTAIVSQGSRSRPRSCWATLKTAYEDKHDSQHTNLYNNFIQTHPSAKKRVTKILIKFMYI